MTESAIKREIRLHVGGREDTRLFNNPVGLAEYRDETGKVVRVVKYGLFTGSADLIGFKSVTITPDMVGQRVAVFVSIETKAARGVEKTHQQNWERVVNEAGGLAGFAKSVDDALKIIRGDSVD